MRRTAVLVFCLTAAMNIQARPPEVAVAMTEYVAVPIDSLPVAPVEQKEDQQLKFETACGLHPLCFELGPHQHSVCSCGAMDLRSNNDCGLCNARKDALILTLRDLLQKLDAAIEEGTIDCRPIEPELPVWFPPAEPIADKPADPVSDPVIVPPFSLRVVKITKVP